LKLMSSAMVICFDAFGVVRSKAAVSGCASSIVRHRRGLLIPSAAIVPAGRCAAAYGAGTVGPARSLQDIDCDAVKAASAAGDVAAQERHERPAEGGNRVERRDPRRSHDRRPVRGLAKEALPGVELRAEQVRL
jgi:hypothetical protein